MKKLIPFILLACSSANTAPAPAPVDAGAPAPDAAPAEEVLVLGSCRVRYQHAEGMCGTAAPECAPLAEAYTRRAVREVEHFLGSIEPAWEDECPESYDFEDFAQAFEDEGCEILCAFRFDIIQEWSP